MLSSFRKKLESGPNRWQNPVDLEGCEGKPEGSESPSVGEQTNRGTEAQTIEWTNEISPHSAGLRAQSGLLPEGNLISIHETLNLICINCERRYSTSPMVRSSFYFYTTWELIKDATSLWQSYLCGFFISFTWKKIWLPSLLSFNWTMNDISKLWKRIAYK